MLLLVALQCILVVIMALSEWANQFNMQLYTVRLARFLVFEIRFWTILGNSFMKIPKITIFSGYYLRRKAHDSDFSNFLIRSSISMVLMKLLWAFRTGIHLSRFQLLIKAPSSWWLMTWSLLYAWKMVWIYCFRVFGYRDKTLNLY